MPKTWPDLITGSLIALVCIYRNTIGTMMLRSCRFLPSCSRYAEQAIKRLGPWRGSWLSMKRLVRCHPFCDGGWDPVP